MSKFDFFFSELYTARPYKGNYAIPCNVLVLYVEVSLCSCLLVKAWQSDAMHGEIGFGDKNFNYKHCTDFKFNVNDRLAELIL